MPVTLVVGHNSDSDRAALVDLLWRVRDLEVVGQAATFDELLEILERRKPNAVVIDLGLVQARKLLGSGSEARNDEPLKLLSSSKVVAVAAPADDAARRLATSLGVAALLDWREVRESLAATVFRVTGSVQGKAAP